MLLNTNSPGKAMPDLLPKGLGSTLFKYSLRADKLFGGDDAAFKQLVQGAKLYAEYGVGKSTRWVLNNTDIEVLAVDSDENWIENVRDQAIEPDRLKASYVDLGELIGWGRPADYTKRDNFALYTDAIWQHEQKPDVVLIDGRFRVACFLTSLKHAEAGAKIIFDDYAKRPHYHVVEEFLAPKHIEGRQAIFEVPDKSQLDMSAIEAHIVQFRLVMD